MDFRIFVEPWQGATFAEQLAVARTAEAAGYSGFFCSDHYLAILGDGAPGPTDAWVTLAGVAVRTSTIRLGTLVTAATFRHPGPLAISVAQIDEMSGGRIELGLGAGWFEAEHSAYAIPYPDLRERFDRFAEQLAVITGLWTTPLGERFSYAGEHFTITDSPALPKPVQRPHPPIIVGGQGTRRTPALAATYAAEFNIPNPSPESAAAAFARVDAALRARGRDPLDVTHSASFSVCAGRDDAETARHADAIGRGVDELRTNTPLVGTPAQIVDRIEPYRQAGVQRVYVQLLDMSDLAQIELFASEVIPQLD